MAKKERRVFTEKELEQIETMAGIRLPRKYMARIMGMSEGYFNQLMKLDDALRLRIEKGQAVASANAFQTLYSQAIGGNMTALIFWMKTQEGLREGDRMELPPGENGEPHEVKTLTPQQRKERILELSRFLKETADEFTDDDSSGTSSDDEEE